MKSILISIKPKHCVNILNGLKTIECRETKPNVELPIDVYIYCCKPRKNEIGCHINYERVEGKVVAKFTLNKVEEILPFEEYESPFGMAYKLTKDKIVCCQKAQLTYDEYNHYLKGKTGYAWHIDNLVIFDKPKELSEFKTPKKLIAYGMSCNYYSVKTLTKAPQSWCYVESEEKE